MKTRYYNKSISYGMYAYSRDELRSVGGWIGYVDWFVQEPEALGRILFFGGYRFVPGRRTTLVDLGFVSFPRAGLRGYTICGNSMYVCVCLIYGRSKGFVSPSSLVLLLAMVLCPCFTLFVYCIPQVPLESYVIVVSGYVDRWMTATATAGVVG
jgi:hypothetical protein